MFFLGAVAAMGREQFLGFYLSAGVVASLTSYLIKTITKQPGLSLGAVSYYYYYYYFNREFDESINIDGS